MLCKLLCISYWDTRILHSSCTELVLVSHAELNLKKRKREEFDQEGEGKPTDEVSSIVREGRVAGTPRLHVFLLAEPL